MQMISDSLDIGLWRPMIVNNFMHHKTLDIYKSYNYRELESELDS